MRERSRCVPIRISIYDQSLNNTTEYEPLLNLRIAPFLRRYNIKKAYWPTYANDIDKCIANITPATENDDKFVNLVRRASHKNTTWPHSFKETPEIKK